MKILILKYLLITLLQTMSLLSLGQKINLKNDSLNRNCFSIGFGGHYTAFYSSSRYIMPITPSEINYGTTSESLVGFKKLDSYSYDFNFDFQKGFRYIIFKTGLHFANITHIYQSDSNAIKNNLIFHSEGYGYKDIIKFHVASHDLELPFGIGYKYRKNQIIFHVSLSINLNYRCVLTDKYDNTTIENSRLFERNFNRIWVMENQINFLPGFMYSRVLGRHLGLYLGVDCLRFGYYNIKTGILYKL